MLRSSYTASQFSAQSSNACEVSRVSGAPNSWIQHHNHDALTITIQSLGVNRASLMFWEEGGETQETSQVEDLVASAPKPKHGAKIRVAARHTQAILLEITTPRTRGIMQRLHVHFLK